MERLLPYLGAVAAIAFIAVLALLPRGASVVGAAPVAATTSNILAVVPAFSPPTAYVPAIFTSPPTARRLPVKTSTMTNAPHETAFASATPKRVSAPLLAPPPETNAPASSSPALASASLNAAANSLRKALVNILCYAPAGSAIHSISGSGVIVSPEGVILTNAHVAQYFLLADQGVSCVVRTGSPAQDAYTADLAFISPAWVHANATVLTESAPSGTGEHDYAFLVISGSVTDAPVNAPFPYVPIAAYPPSEGDPVVIGSYGAQFLQSSQIEYDLFPTIVFGSVKSRYTFGENAVDVVSLGGSAAAQEGSSGGGVVDAHGALVGTITTSTVTGSTALRSLDAITASYVRGAYASETGKPLGSLLAESTTTAVAGFSSDASALEAIILNAIGA